MTTQKSTLIKSNGDRISKAAQGAIETASALRPEIGLALRNTLLSSLNSPSVSNEGEEEPVVSYSTAVLNSVGEAIKDTSELIKALREKAKGYASSGAEWIDKFSEEFITWAQGLSPLEDSEGKAIMLEGVNAEGIRVILPARDAVRNSIRFLLFSLTELSTRAYLGENSRVTKSGKRTEGKKSIFDTPQRGVEGLEINGGNEGWILSSTVKYKVIDRGGQSGSQIRKALELIAKAGAALNQNNLAEVEIIVKALQGENPSDRRFSFNPSLVEAFTVARVYGLFCSNARQWAKELEQAIKDGKQAQHYKGSEELRLQQLTKDLSIARNREQLEAEVSFTEKAKKLVQRIANTEFSEFDFSPVEISKAVEALKDGVEIESEKDFLDFFSDQLIRDYFLEVTADTPSETETVQTATA